MQHDISLVLPHETGLGAVFISDLKAAQSLSLLKELKIGAIITANLRGKLTHPAKEIPRYLYLPVQDLDSFNIVQYFDLSSNFIEESRRRTNVLVHCTAGVSRSATLVAAYIISKTGISMDQAIQKLKRRRRKVFPNRGFQVQLQNWRKKKWEKHVIYEQQQTMSSPLGINAKNSDLLLRTKLSQNEKNKPQGPLNLRRAASATIPDPQKSKKKDRLSRERLTEKIERVKEGLMNKLVQSGVEDAKGKSKSLKKEEITFSSLLQSKIYQNKLKVRI